MPQLIALHSIITREKKGGPRIVIPAGSRFNPEDYPMISDKEWEAMYRGTPPIIRHPDDPAFVAPAPQRAAAAEPVEAKGATDDDKDAPPARKRAAAAEPVEAKGATDDDKDAPPARKRAAPADDDEV